MWDPSLFKMTAWGQVGGLGERFQMSVGVVDLWSARAFSSIDRFGDRFLHRVYGW
jgi:hypothetical protein